MDIPDIVSRGSRAQASEESRRAAPVISEVRGDRVEAVRGRLAAGTLGVDPEQIAGVLLDQGIISF